MKCADVITLAVTDPWHEIEFETRDLPPHCSSPSEGAGEAMSWELYAKLVKEHLHFSESAVQFSQQLYQDICREKDLGAREIELIQVISDDTQQPVFYNNTVCIKLGYCCFKNC